MSSYWIFVALLASALSVTAASPPSLVLILADDLGWADLGGYGNQFNETPRLDQLAREGLRFTQAYAGPVCSPTRAHLQSGRDQARYGITQHIPGHRRPFARLLDPPVPSHLPLDVETFAERLRAAGYATGYFGKWHLGGPDHGPDRQGWDTALEFSGHTIPSRKSEEGSPRRAADFLAEKAEQFIFDHKDRPFVLQVAPYAVHIPLTAKTDLLAKYQAKPSQPPYPSRPDYAAILEELDACVGRIVDAVDRAGIAHNTLIVFVSDNGGLVHPQNGPVVTSNAPLRGEKGSLYEGGIRVPAIARWPGRIGAGGESAIPISTMDLPATFFALAGIAASPEQSLDGTRIDALFTHPDRPLSRDALHWHLPHYHHSTPASAIRRGDWKLIWFYEDDAAELYHLGDDPGEAANLAAREPERVAELREALKEWRLSVNAQMPTPNPDYDPSRANELARPRPGAEPVR
jgi:arylsulfatase A